MVCVEKKFDTVITNKSDQAALNILKSISLEKLIFLGKSWFKFVKITIFWGDKGPELGVEFYIENYFHQTENKSYLVLCYLCIRILTYCLFFNCLDKGLKLWCGFICFKSFWELQCSIQVHVCDKTKISFCYKET